MSNVIRLSSGTAIASLIPILLQPLLRNIYSPEAFGALSVYLSVVGILVVISSFKYEVAIALPQDTDDARALLHLSIFLALLLNILAFIVLFIFHDKIIYLWKYPDKYQIWIYLIPLSALLFSIYNGFLYYMIRNKRFLFIGVSKIFRRSVEGIGQVFISTGRNIGLGLFIGDIIGQIANVLSGLLFSVHGGLRILKPDLSRIYKMAERYRQFAIYNTLPTLFNTLTIALPIFLVNIKFGERFTGYLDLTRLILFIPIVFISEPLSQVLLQRFNDYRNQNKSIFSDFIKTLIIIIGTGLLGVILIYLFVNPLILWIFGQTWIESAEFAKILIIGIFFKFISEPFKLVFAAFEKIKVFSVWQTIYFLTILCMFFIHGLGIRQFLKVFVILESVCYIVLLSLIIIQITRYEKLISKSA